MSLVLILCLSSIVPDYIAGRNVLSPVNLHYPAKDLKNLMEAFIEVGYVVDNDNNNNQPSLKSKPVPAPVEMFDPSVIATTILKEEDGIKSLRELIDHNNRMCNKTQSISVNKLPSSQEVLAERHQPAAKYQCGRSMIKNSPYRTSRIVGGNQAYPGEFPWTVSIQMNERHYCAGSLINDRWILTAAHCFYGRLPFLFRIQLGSIVSPMPLSDLPILTTRNDQHSTLNTMNASAMDKNHLNIPMGTIIIHENYSIPRPFANDIALVSLQWPINFTDYILPICLPKNQDTGTDESEGVSTKNEALLGEKGIVVGWGWTLEKSHNLDDAGQSKQLQVLKKVEVPIIDNGKCMQWYKMKGKSVKITQKQFCAGYEQGGKDACRGDSGGPMVIKNPESQQYEIIGIVSAGVGCALPHLPGLYTKVSHYMPWIMKHIS